MSLKYGQVSKTENLKFKKINYGKGYACVYDYGCNGRPVTKKVQPRTTGKNETGDRQWVHKTQRIQWLGYKM